MGAVIYIGHGSRTEQGNKQFESFIQETLELIDVPIKAFGYLENATPSIIEAIENCVEQGATEISVIPVLLLPGIHSNIDIPVEMEKGKKKFPYIQFRYGEPLGSDPIVANIILSRLEEKDFLNNTEETLLLVGHGSRNPQAQSEFEKLASNLREQLIASVHTSYLKTEPFYGDVLDELVHPFKKIYILPHLLFTGGFQKEIEETCRKFKNSDLVLCDPIGFDDKLKELLVRRLETTTTLG
ncbi:sirohydrochlorin chelatase [Bacillus sp. 31A1R]|uniref:Sirohydrochlorin chelatase n=1 Tax=Robertmurraya mangrovi TaxID=3098077 RepID=A0ABU5J0T0_9BACI|nr:sirohydrochlorin chelatase [Bacillus sp. 31A1R]MDZ5473009.1 sirohydrochlorin chelatase [Bacillus sp. 31A1R]